MAYQIGNPSYLGLPTDAYGNPSVVGNQSTFGASPSMTAGGFMPGDPNNPFAPQGQQQSPWGATQPPAPQINPQAAMGLLSALMKTQGPSNGQQGGQAQMSQPQMPSFQPQVPSQAPGSAMQSAQFGAGQQTQPQFSLGNYYLGPPTQQTNQPRNAPGQTGNHPDNSGLRDVANPMGDALSRLMDALRIRSVKNTPPVAQEKRR